MTTTDTADRYRERLLPNPSGWLLAPGVGVSVWVLLSILGPAVALVAGLAATGVTVVLLVGTSQAVRVTDDAAGSSWHAGRATIPVALLGPPEVLDAAAMRAALGPELDSAAYVCHRIWVPTGVRVPVLDPADPTPYWLVTTRNPDRLAAVLVEAGAQAAHSEQTG